MKILGCKKYEVVTGTKMTEVLSCSPTGPEKVPRNRLFLTFLVVFTCRSRTWKKFCQRVILPVFAERIKLEILQAIS